MGSNNRNYVMGCIVFLSHISTATITPLLVLSVIRCLEHSALLHLDTGSLKVPNCQLSHRVNESEQWSLVTSYQPADDGTITLQNLQPQSKYEVQISCTEAGGTTVFRSNLLNFTLAPWSSSAVTPVTEPDMITTDVDLSTTGEHSIILKEKIVAGTPAVDIALGVVFGLIGFGIICTVVYYVLKKFRREQRIRRFLQYRHQEDDPFPGISPDD